MNYYLIKHQKIMSQERKEFIKQLEDWGFKYSESSKFLAKIVGDLDVSLEIHTGDISVYENYVGVLERVSNPTLQDVINLAKKYLDVTLELPNPVKAESTWVLIGDLRVDLSKVKNYQLEGSDLIINAKEYAYVDIALDTYEKAIEVIEKLDKYFNVTPF